MLEQDAGPGVELQGKEITEVPTPVTAEELLAKAGELGEQLRALIVATKKLPREKNSIQAHQDPSRSLSLAQVNLQQGLMWLRRAIQSPKEF